MFDELHKEIDAVVVSTPDHTHAVVAMAALELGKHVYCEKPLTHSIHEARVLAETAAAAQGRHPDGQPGHSSEGTRRVVELIRGRRDRPGPRGPRLDQPADLAAGRRPARRTGRRCPQSLHWDLWLGPAPERPYHPAYHPFNWRGWWDFGTGALGDMGCHILDAAFWALDLHAPDDRRGREPADLAPSRDRPGLVDRPLRVPRPGQPAAAEAHLVRRRQAAAARPVRRPAARQGEQRQHLRRREGPAAGPARAGRGLQAPAREASSPASTPPKPTLPRSPGHHAEWIEACKTGKPTGTSFDYAGPLTELVLLGNVALRAGRKIEWDAAAHEADERRSDR